MFKPIITILMLILSSGVSASNLNFSCQISLLDSDLNSIYSENWSLTNFNKSGDGVYSTLLYKEIVTKTGLELTEKIYAFYSINDRDHLYIKANVDFDYRSKLMKESRRKHYTIKDRIKFNKRSNYSNGTTNLSFFCFK
jgi:hypothetical protein